MHVVLVEPEIPSNTGNIARLCAATTSILHLVGKLGFRIDDKHVRRAGVDYWHLVQIQYHNHFQAFYQTFKETSPHSQFHLFSTASAKSYLQIVYKPGDALIFGRESVGLPVELLHQFHNQTVAIPTLGPVRSLNLANAVGIALFESLRQIGALDTTFLT
ncbi:hypothetical protein BCY86_08050 [Pajaroellobacter abortibovis]|uniref:Putative tRNA (cytidine(34)-2'-O)-methyltransferase n=2 Tax=Pajaroellobacter abortibovis TaxID=1882918 RepID=A0A1L6MYX1_9BACT|nr:hypothetical protein BCY86_08050 [Pajaroellobacter abortibovis]